MRKALKALSFFKTHKTRIIIAVVVVLLLVTALILTAHFVKRAKRIEKEEVRKEKVERNNEKQQVENWPSERNSQPDIQYKDNFDDKKKKVD